MFSVGKIAPDTDLLQTILSQLTMRKSNSLPQPLPPLNALRAFEAIARHLSFAKAADELHVTPAALSHQIRGLEEQLGLALFNRRTRSIELTDAGRTLYPGLHAGFESVRGAVAQLDRAREGNILVISATPGGRQMADAAAVALSPRASGHRCARRRQDEARGFRRRRGRRRDPAQPGQPPRALCREAVRRFLLPVCAPRLVEQGLRAPPISRAFRSSTTTSRCRCARRRSGPIGSARGPGASMRHAGCASTSPTTRSMRRSRAQGSRSRSS